MKAVSLLIPAALPVLAWAASPELSRGAAVKSLTKVDASAPVSSGIVKHVGQESTLVSHRSGVPVAKYINWADSKAGMPAIYGSVVAANSWQTTSGNVGIYKLPLADGEGFEQIAAGPDATYGGALAGDTYYCTSALEKWGMTFVKVASYDATTWTVKNNATASVSNLATDLAYDKSSGKVYGCFKKEYGTGSYLATMNLSTLGIDVIASTNDDWCAFAIDNDGTLYGIIKESLGGSTMSSSLYKINKTNGSKTLVGETGCLPHYLSSACIDATTGRMFWAVSTADDSAALYEVDKASGHASLVCNFADGEEVTGLFTLTPEAAADAPAAVSELVASFPEGSLSGKVCFDAPTTLFSGDKGEGALSYRVMHGTSQLASGSTSFGAHVEVPLTVKTSGIYELSVYVSNASGDSPASSVSLFIGKGTPSAPVVTARYDGTSFIVDWTPVTESADGGYLDPSKVTYKIVRYPSGVVVETATTATSVTNVYDEPDAISKFWYGVTAMYEGKAAKEALSNNVFLGSMTPPLTQSFAEEKDIEPYSIINANDDERTWKLESGEMSVHYNKTLPMDDWFISPAVNLEKGKSYRIILSARVQSSGYPEAFEVKFGKAPTAEAMTLTAIGKTVINNTEYANYDGFLIPSETGRHYIGIHACSEANSYCLYVQGFEIESPMSAAAPAAPAAMRTVPDPNGAFRTTIYVTAPEVDFNNEPLESLSHLELFRDGKLIKTFRPVAPSEEVSFIDEMSTGGVHTYFAAAYNEFGKGEERAVEAYVGVNRPAAPSVANIVETENDGEVTVSWPKVETDFAGNPLNPDLVTYTVWQLKAETHVVIYDNIKDTSCTFRAVTPPDQTFVHFFVSAETEGGISQLTETDLIPCGQPYAVPFNEKFKDGDTESIMAIGDEGTALWSLMKDNNSIGITSRDGDNGFLLSRGKAEGDFASVHTAKIKLEGITNPGVSFYTYNVNVDGTPDRNTIDILVDDGTGFEVIKSAEVCSLGENPGWVMMSASLEEYDGKTILIGFRTTVHSYFETIIDDIKVASLTDYDVAVTESSAPASAPFNKPFAIEARIENLGVLAANSFEVRLMCDGAIAASKPIAVLAPGEYTTVSFEPVFNALQKDAASYSVEVVFDADLDLSNNTSETMLVAPQIPTLPIVTDIKAVSRAGNAEITWGTPDVSAYEAVPVTEGFEEYDSFSTGSFGEWTTYDGDKAAIGSISDLEIPGIPFGSQQSWWVMDADYEKFNLSFTAHSGHRYLAQMYSVAPDGTAYQCDDWIISPRLSGKEQTISFYARSYSGTYPESFEVMVSQTGSDIADFTMLDNRSGIMADWTLYSFSLPEGTQYFAIRCVSLNKFMMFIDEVTCTPASSANVEIIGYNLWRDGELIATTGAATKTFTEPLTDNSDPIYVVTTLYNAGESAPSDEAHLTVAGLEQLDSAGVTVRADGRHVVVTGAQGLEINVYSADGRSMAKTIGSASATRIPLAQGIYIVNVGTTTAKIIIR